MRLYGSLQAALVTVAYPAVHGLVLLKKSEGALRANSVYQLGALFDFSSAWESGYMQFSADW